jgi:transcriptional regulator with XRE-family HTH domain
VSRSARIIDVQVGRRIILRRQQLGISQTKLSEALGVSFQQVQKYEKGVNRIAAGRLAQIARILKVPVTWFFEEPPLQSFDAKTRAEMDSIETFIASPEAKTLARIFSSISDRRTRRQVARAILSLINSFADKKKR